jgi:hypothetical protein
VAPLDRACYLLRMREPRYSAAPYRMRNDVAWMVYDDRNRRVVMLRLSERTAYTLARTLNVAQLEAPLVEDKVDHRAKAKKAEAKKKADAKKL